MKTLIILSCLISTITVFSRVDAADPVSLFNGKDLTGWLIQGNGQFAVADGVIKINQGTGWLRSDKVFTDFTLIMEFRFLEPNANSGIFVRTAAPSRDDENSWPIEGIQVQCMDTLEGDRHLGAMINYGIPPFQHISNVDKLKKVYRPTGEWQRYEITCIGDTLAVLLNGELITLAIGIEARSGHVGIQGEHGLLEFRKIEIIPR